MIQKIKTQKLQLEVVTKVVINRQIKFQRITIKFHNITGFIVINNSAVNPKDNGFTVVELRRRDFP